jgi:SulP family sulfate permease
VGIVALPLAIGFGIASGVTPGQGLWTAILGGFLVSALGGSKVQIGGPTGAFVPVLAGIVALYGYDGLSLATMMAGIFLFFMGVCKMGNLIKFIPYPVVAGFTSGIAVIIFVGQLKEFLGINVALPTHVPQQLALLAENLPRARWQTLALGLLSLAILLLWPKRWGRVPASMVAVVAATAGVALFHPAVQTIGSKFGGIPRGFPGFHFPVVTFSRVEELMPAAFTIAVLGAIESLLSAMVADGMIESHHDSNQELTGQGIANLLTPLLGGIAVTGAIARTGTNIRSGARTPVAGIIHSLTLLLVILVAAPLARLIPLAALSAVLLVVAYRMGEWHNFVALARGPKSDFGVLVLTFSLTVIFDLTIAVGVGLLAAGALFVRRMEEITQVRLVTEDTELEIGSDSIREKNVPDDVLVYRIEGPFFFGVAEKLDAALSRSLSQPRVVIFRMRKAPAIDATGLRALELTLDKFQRRGTQLVLSGIQPQPMKVLFQTGFVDKIGLDNICPNIDVSLARARKILEQGVAG